MITGKYTGLTSEQVKVQRKKSEVQKLQKEGLPGWLEILLSIITEPLFLILVATAGIYFLLGENEEAWIMLAALGFVSGISLFQEHRSSRAEKALKSLLEPKIKVFRNAEFLMIEQEDLVLEDVFLIEDGDLIPADAKLLESHDLTINESILTGESIPLYKGLDSNDRDIFQGTQVMSGYGIAEVKFLGRETRLGKIQQQLKNIQAVKTPIQIQIQNFVQKMVQFGLVAFAIIWAIQYYITQNFIFGLLKGLTLSMSVLPEEIPVAFSTFMALGALQLYKNQVLVKNPMTVETLGGVSVLCLDKTGTITENQMQLEGIYSFQEGKLSQLKERHASANKVIEFAMWSSEESPFDPMEQSIHQAYEQICTEDLRLVFSMVREYPLAGRPPMMIHVFENPEGQQLLACKGGLESVIKICGLTPEEEKRLVEQSQSLADLGHRVLAVAGSNERLSDFPADPFEFKMQMLGLVSFYDPPKKNIKDTIRKFYQAGIDVKILSGDFSNTTLAVARQIGIQQTSKYCTGDEVMAMNEQSLVLELNSTAVFSRMYPEAKLKVIETLKNSGQIVSMTGDGVNDGPALKASHIGIAMGRKGSELARRSSSLILANDDLSKLVDGIALGRRIYENLKKAIQYIISIHIPIILIVTLPLIFFWDYTDFFSPVHVVFLELIMGPTCSIVFENEPIEPQSMVKPPRKSTNELFTWSELNTSIVQGLVITAFCLAITRYAMYASYPEEKVRSLLYTNLVFANLFLTLVNRSFIESIWTTLRYKNKLVPLILGISILALMTTLYHPALQTVFRFEALKFAEVMMCAGLGFLSVIWMEFFKWRRRKSGSNYSKG